MMRLSAFACLVALLSGDPASADQALVVIAHPSRPSQLSADEIERIYLKRQRYWKDGQPVVPINREATSTSRKAFDRQFLGRSQLDLVGYWNQRYFHGVLPPATLESDEAIKRYVASDPNAVGYIAAERVDDSVRVVNRPN